jgi:hypothetical protein
MGSPTRPHRLGLKSLCVSEPGGWPLLWTLALPPPSPLEGVSLHRAHVPALLAHPCEAATDQPDGQYEPDSYEPEQGDFRRRSLLFRRHQPEGCR